MIYSFFDPRFWLFAAFSPIVFLLTFYVPGSFFIDRLKPKSTIISFLLASVLGVVMWGMQGFVFGYLNIRWCTYLYLLFFVFMFWKRMKEKKVFAKKLVKEIKGSFKIALGFLCVGTLIQVLPVIASGMAYKNGIEFFFTNAVDGIMHLAYIQSISHYFPPQEPGAVGLALVNYHYWSDLVLAELVRIWHLPTSHLFFQFTPLFISFFTGAVAYLLLRIWKLPRQAGLWSLFFLYFSADAAYLFMLALHHRLGFETPVIDNGVTQFLNIPHTFAKLIFLTALIPFSYWIQTKKKKWLLLSIIFFSTLVGFKVYFGIFAAIGMSFVVALQFLQSLFYPSKKPLLKKLAKAVSAHRFSFFMIGLFALLSAVIYFPTNKSSGGLFYAPLEWPKLFLAQDALDFRIWWLRQQVYEAHNNTRGIFLLNSLAVFICLVSVYGTRLLGFFRWKKIASQISWQLHLFFLSGIIIFTLLGLFTLQSSGLFNVFNFFSVAAVGLSIFSAVICYNLSQSKKVFSYFLLAIIVLITLPRSFHEIFSIYKKYADNKYDYIFTFKEIEALQIIRKNTPQDAIVQSSLYNENERYTPYVSFFSDRRTYLSGERLLETHNQPYKERVEDLRYIFNSHNYEELDLRARDKGINILYLVKRSTHAEDLSFTLQKDNKSILFENDTAVVLKVR
jgi:hypothetical protein